MAVLIKAADMNKFTKTLTIFFLVWFVPFSKSAYTQVDPDLDKLDRFLTNLFEHDKFMGSAAVLSDDEIIFSRAYGFIDEEKTLSTPETIYRTGSITKTFTSAILLRLAEEGKTDLSETLDKYYPQIPNSGEITIEQMLRHRSGLVSFTNMPEYADYNTGEITKEEMLERFVGYGTEFNPDEKMQYSNTGYVLLGYIIEDITGGTFQEALNTYITEPLGMERTFHGSTISFENNEAQSFVRNGGWQKAPETNMFIPHGAGAVSSTPAETAMFYRYLFSGNLISKSSLERMIEAKDGMGMGIFLCHFMIRRHTAIPGELMDFRQ
ncbi:MAG: beta-lactamase family protein [Balneolaceae bacterium]|nr:beta-lactamase family protein [Balneolaceae bacterium]